ncbi:MAG: S-methyl-5'-thioadenosine phosphorylase [Lentisphaerae bacterium]|nr:S-methyl-5'-thioadenosine phosphorylase [Lentisphaerota bacterium]
MTKIGIIGGSGIGNNLGVTNPQRQKVHTPYGAPSDLMTTGKIADKDVVVIARHGADHRLMPSDVNYRANIWAMKTLGVTHIIAATACGSLREEIEPGHMVFIDQFIDRTTKRAQTFYVGHAILHLPMSEPFCPNMRKVFIEQAKSLDLSFHEKGTTITIEGPRFSTKAESLLFKSWGADVINMTTVPEAVLAREAGICYAAIGLCSDYDCWHETKEPVSMQMILATMRKNAANLNKLIQQTVVQIYDQDCICKIEVDNLLS